MTGKLVLTAATYLMLCASLVACGEDAPAVCDSAEQLQSSIDKLRDVEVMETNGIDEFKTQFETVEGDLDQLANDAKSEFASQVDAVAESFEALETSLQVATDDPSADILAGVATAFSAFRTDVQALISDVESTC